MPPPTIVDYKFGRIVVDGAAYTQDIIIFPDRVQENWWREAGHSVSVGDLETIFKAKPSHLILGLGTASKVQIPAETMTAIMEADIDVTALPTGEACYLYNEMKDRERVIAGLHLTC
jgi:hypothetical protein